MIDPGFKKKMFTSCDYDTFDPEKFFAQYHYYEVYDSTKQYNDEPFQMDYGKGMHTYHYTLMEIRDLNRSLSDEVKTVTIRPISEEGVVSEETIKIEVPYYDSSNDKKFVIAKEILSDEELEELKKYCNCLYHQSNFYDKRNICGCCVGCLYAGSHYSLQNVIDEARQRKNDGVAPHADESIFSFKYLTDMTNLIVGAVIICVGIFIVYTI